MRLSRRQFFRRSIWAAPGLCLADAVAVEPRWLSVRKLTLAKGEVRHRFAQLTDIHFKGDDGYLHRVVAEVNALVPDFVCFTGDLIEEARFLPPALEILREIHAPIFGIPGNHDHWSGADFTPIREMFAATGGAWLQNQQVTIRGGAVNLMGLDRLPARFATDPDVFNLLLVHYPIWADLLEGMKCDLALAGHSHGGQVRLPFYGSVITPSLTGRYDLGMFDTPAGPLYVNPGIGTFHLDVRFNCRPEVTLFEI